MGLISNIKDSVTWVAGAALEPVGKLLKLDIGGAVGSVFRIPYKLLQGGLSLFGMSSLQKQRAAQEATRKEMKERFPNGSPGHW